MHLKRKLTIGFLSSLFIIVYYIFSWFIDSPEPGANQRIDLHQVVNLLIFNIFNISIWIVLRDLILSHYKQAHLALDFSGFLSLLIILPFAFILLILYKSPVLFYLLIAIGFAEIFFLIRLLLKFTHIQKDEIPNIEYLKNFSISTLLVLIVSFTIGLLSIMGKFDKIEKVSDYILIIPYFFLLLFFNQERRLFNS